MKPFVLPEDLHPAERRRLARLARRKAERRPPPTPGIGSYKPYLVELPPEGVERFITDEQRRACAAMVTLACKDLGILPPFVTWLLEIAPAVAGQLIERGMDERLKLVRRNRPVGGLAGRSAGKIWIRARDDLSPERIATVTAHEVRHCWQYEHRPKMTVEEMEEDAEAYEVDAVERLPWREEAERMHPRAVPLWA